MAPLLAHEKPAPRNVNPQWVERNIGAQFLCSMCDSLKPTADAQMVSETKTKVIVVICRDCGDDVDKALGL